MAETHEHPVIDSMPKTSRRTVIKQLVGLGLSALFIGGGIPRATEIQDQDTLLQRKLEILDALPLGFGFNTHLRPVGNGETLTPTQFTHDVDLLKKWHQRWLRFDLSPSHIISSSTPAQIIWNDNGMQMYRQAAQYAHDRERKIHLVTNAADFTKGFNTGDLHTTTKEYYTKLAKEFPQIEVWQLFNEPNVHHYRDYGTPVTNMSAEYIHDFAQVVNVASQAIKEVLPQAKTTVNFSRWVGNFAPSSDIRTQGMQFFSALANDIDTITLDLYPDLSPREIQALPEYVEMLAHALKKPIIIGELGLPTVGQYNDNSQANSISAAITSLVSGSTLPEAIMFYELHNEKTTGDTVENSFGIYGKNSFRPILHTMASAGATIIQKKS